MERGLTFFKRTFCGGEHRTSWLQHVLFLNHFRQGQCEEALEAAENFRLPGLFWDPVDRAVALGALGRQEEAERAVAEILKLQPDFAQRPRRYLECYILQDNLLELVIVGLEKAGLQPGRPKLSLV